MLTLASLRRLITAHHLAQLAISAELLATMRALGEIFRRRGEVGFGLDAALPYVAGGMIALGFVVISVLCYFAGSAAPACSASSWSRC